MRIGSRDIDKDRGREGEREKGKIRGEKEVFHLQFIS